MTKYFVLYASNYVPYACVELTEFSDHLKNINKLFGYVGKGKVSDFFYIDSKTFRGTRGFFSTLSIRDTDKELTKEEFQCYKVLYG